MSMVETRTPNVREFKAQRILYLTGQIEAMRQIERETRKRIAPMIEEKNRLIEHLGYDPSLGKVPV